MGRGLLDYMIKNPLPDADISVFSIPSNQSLATPVITKALDSILGSDIRIVLLHGSQITNVLSLALDRDMIDDTHTWIGTHWCTPETIQTIGNVGKHPLMGTICFSPAAPRNTDYNTWKTRLIAQNTSSNYYATAPETAFIDAAYAYDSLFTIAYGIRAFHSSASTLTGQNLYKLMLLLTFLV